MKDIISCSLTFKSFRPEKIVHKRIEIFTDDNAIINEEQDEFRKQYSTIHKTKRIVNIINHNKSMRTSTEILLLDIEKAFDTVWHNGLLYKLQQFRYPQYIIHTVKNFLKNRKFQVHLKDEYSSTVFPKD